MKITIHIDNAYSEIYNYPYLNAVLRNEIINCVSYFVQGAQFSVAFREGKWNGKECLITNKGKFPTGVLSRIVTTLEQLNHQVELNDVREITNPTISPIGVRWKGVRLRDYQKEAVDTAIKATRGIIEIPTRGGKTLIAGKIIQKLGLRTLYIVNGKESMYQTRSDLMDCLALPESCFGLYGDGHKTRSDITIGLIQSLSKQKPEWFMSDILIIDEIHKAGAKGLYNWTMKCDAYYRFGISGTPFRTDGKDMKIMAVTGKIIHRETQTDMWEQGYIERPIVKWVDPKAPPIHRSLDYKKAYALGVINNDARNDKVVDIVNAHKGEQILISVENIEHGEILMNKLMGNVWESPFFMCGSLDSSRRYAMFDQFKNGLIKIMIATRLMNESVTINNLSVLINCAGRKSEIELIQKLGRVQTKVKGKSNVKVYDFIDRHSHFLYNQSAERMKLLKRREYEQQGWK